ncbi:MAG TPA: winged helix-turn-helix domain-containing protein, partial [Terriglobales bacterium]|nr:winged helix-turn-helix domain-containing protein [Terriglobales bacterium]
MADLFRYPPVMENAGLPPVIRFGACEVDSRAGELRKNGIKIRIQQQPFQVLMALLERPGGVVSREELRSRLWPNDTFVDFEHGLNAAVKRLRDALGESAENPVFIETLAKRGYRFVGSVSGNHASHPAMHPPTSPTPTLPRQHFPTVVIGVAAGILISLSVAILWRKPAPDGSKPPFDGLEFRLTANSPENPVTAAALSPDGKYLAYSDSTGLYLKLVSTGETHAIGLPKDFRGMPVNWFPDSAHLLLVGDQVGDRGLWSISLSGAGLSKLAESGLSGSVSPDGSQIA